MSSTLIALSQLVQSIDRGAEGYGLTLLVLIVQLAVSVAVAWCVFSDASTHDGRGRAPLFPAPVWGLATFFISWHVAILYAVLRFGPWFDGGRRVEAATGGPSDPVPADADPGPKVRSTKWARTPSERKDARAPRATTARARPGTAEGRPRDRRLTQAPSVGHGSIARLRAAAGPGT